MFSHLNGERENLSADQILTPKVSSWWRCGSGSKGKHWSVMELRHTVCLRRRKKSLSLQVWEAAVKHDFDIRHWQTISRMRNRSNKLGSS